MSKERSDAAKRPLDRRVARQRDRSMMSRYEYADDRKDFWRWRRAAGPCQLPYWRFDGMRGRLTIELCKGERVMCYDLTATELEMARNGWRWLVAQAVRQVRRAFTHNDQIQGAEPLAAKAPSGMPG